MQIVYLNYDAAGRYCITNSVYEPGLSDYAVEAWERQTCDPPDCITVLAGCVYLHRTLQYQLKYPEEQPCQHPTS